jgi:catalase
MPFFGVSAASFRYPRKASGWVKCVALRPNRFPAWRVFYQILPVQPNYPDLTFDPLDTTKIWPTDKLPFRPLGRIVLNENVMNEYLENEQIAFSPGRMVPGILPTADKMLQGRIFSYADTQRYRMGVNYQLLPINAPKNVHYEAHQNGAMNFLKQSNEINYFPSTMSPLHESLPYVHDPEPLSGLQTRQNIPLTDDFNQAGDKWRGFDAARQMRFAERVAATLAAERVTDNLRTIWYGYWKLVDPTLASMIEQAVNAMLVQKDPHMLAIKNNVIAAASGSTHQ